MKKTTLRTIEGFLFGFGAMGVLNGMSFATPEKIIAFGIGLAMLSSASVMAIYLIKNNDKKRGD